MSGLETNLKRRDRDQVIMRPRPRPPAKGRDRDRDPKNWSQDLHHCLNDLLFCHISLLNNMD